MDGHKKNNSTGQPDTKAVRSDERLTQGSCAGGFEVPSISGSGHKLLEARHSYPHNDAAHDHDEQCCDKRCPNPRQLAGGLDSEVSTARQQADKGGMAIQRNRSKETRLAWSWSPLRAERMRRKTLPSSAKAANSAIDDST